MKIISFNVNSIRARQEILHDFLTEHSPDIIGLQETKVRDEEFPMEIYADLGYEIIAHGQKTHYGVALLSKTPPKDFCKGFTGDGEERQRRLIYASFETEDGNLIHVINGYFPQGESRDHATKFPDKLKFYGDLEKFLTRFTPKDRVLIMGDFNISPEDIDVGIGEENKKRWLRTGKCSFLPEERELYGKIKKLGFHDTYRKFFPESNELSWFDYRSKGFEDDPKRGLRIDHILVSEPLLQLCSDAQIDYETRAKPKPSDHCPVIAIFDLKLKNF